MDGHLLLPAQMVLAQQRVRAENTLVLLIAASLPTDLPPAGSLASPQLVEDLPAGLPADLLSRPMPLLTSGRSTGAVSFALFVAIFCAFSFAGTVLLLWREHYHLWAGLGAPH